jgi:hypothetical protein
MNGKGFILPACIAWAAALTSAAGPANAVAITTQNGDYASCSSSYDIYELETCVPTQDGINQLMRTTYKQVIRFTTVGCTQGDCGVTTGTVYTSEVYGVGRKPVTSMQPTCTGTKKVYYLGSCAC